MPSSYPKEPEPPPTSKTHSRTITENYKISKNHSTLSANQIITKSINAGLAGFIGTVITFPIDLVKTRWQNQITIAGRNVLYSSLTDCFSKIRQAEGLRGFYRGATVACLTIIPEKIAKLVSNDLMREWLRGEEESTADLGLFKTMVAGAVAGASQSVFNCPMEVIKITLQDAGRIAAIEKSRRYFESVSARKLIINQFKSQGVIGMYRGFGPLLSRNVCFSVVYFPVFFHSSALGGKFKHPEDSNSFWSFCSGCIAGATAAAVATPFDVVKTRQQRLRLATGDVEYKSSFQALSTIFRTEGPRALMKGAGMRMMSIAPLFGIVQAVYYFGVAEFFLDGHLKK